MVATALTFIATSGHNMLTHWRYKLMCQDGCIIQQNATNRREGTDRESHGEMMEVFTLGDTKITAGLKGRYMSCNKIKLTHSIMSSIKEEKR